MHAKIKCFTVYSFVSDCSLGTLAYMSEHRTCIVRGPITVDMGEHVESCDVAKYAVIMS